MCFAMLANRPNQAAEVRHVMLFTERSRRMTDQSGAARTWRPWLGHTYLQVNSVMISWSSSDTTGLQRLSPYTQQGELQNQPFRFCEWRRSLEDWF